MRLSFDEAGALLDELAAPFPEALFEGLNGGVNLREEVMLDPDFPDREMYVMGDYRDNLLGRYINLYYGSFAALAEKEDWTLEDWREELRQTLSHELTHHMEGRSGLHALEDRDEEEKAAWRERFVEEDRERSSEEPEG